MGAGVLVLAAATGAAAYTGALPAPLQSAAHHLVGAPDSDTAGDDTPAPAPSPTTTQPSSSPTSRAAGAVGPDATGSPAQGLCTAWSHGGLARTSVAYRNLAAAGGGADGIAAYCATVTEPVEPTATHGHSPSSHPTGSPTSHPGGSPTSHPGGGPTGHPTGSPTSHPGHGATSHPTGSPTARAGR